MDKSPPKSAWLYLIKLFGNIPKAKNGPGIAPGP